MNKRGNGSLIENNSNDFYVNVLIKDKKFRVFCGEAKQRLRWLTDVVIHKYERYFSINCGLAYGMKLENGNLCDLNDVINTVLHNNENVWVLLKEEYDVFQEDLKKKLSKSLSGKSFGSPKK